MKLFKSKKNLDDVISSLFHYSFDEINWEYKNLTEFEKKAVSEKEFELLKLKFRKDGSNNN